MGEKKLWEYDLLEDVKKDAIKKAHGKEVTEEVYAAIIQMLKLANCARKDGLLELLSMDLEDMDKNPESGSEPYSLSILQMGVEYIVSGIDYNIIEEILTTGYWVKDPQGMEALTCYICILGLMQMEGISNGDFTPYVMEVMLTALLPREYMAEYERQREKRMPKQEKMLEELLEKKTRLTRRSIMIGNVLEEKMNQVTDDVIKAGIRKSGRTTDIYAKISVALRGLDKAYREKLLSCIPPTRRNLILEDELFIGAVRTTDVEDAMVILLECFEEAEQEINADKSNAPTAD